MSIQIGNGTVVSGLFSSIEWGSTAHFIKLEADFNGGTNYVLLGTQELMSVPYAMYASKTDTSVLNLQSRLANKINISDTASMLFNYRLGLDSKVNISDTASMLLNYLRKSDDLILELRNEINLLKNHFKVQDIDGNFYNTVTIGGQTWMSENLRVSRYNNGDEIPIITDNNTWNNSLIGARTWWINDSILYENPYGNLYNGYAVIDSRKICPLGWSIPSESEWNTLIEYLGGYGSVGNKINSTNPNYWITWRGPRGNFTNESGFTAISSGYRHHNNGGFDYFGEAAVFWSNTFSVIYPNILLSLFSYFTNQVSMGGTPLLGGASIRCLKD